MDAADSIPGYRRLKLMLLSRGNLFLASDAVEFVNVLVFLVILQVAFLSPSRGLLLRTAPELSTHPTHSCRTISTGVTPES